MGNGQMQQIILVIIAASTLFLPGSDIYTHLHQSWLYNYMLDHGEILQTDFSMLSGHQPMYGMGVLSYVISGIGWFWFQAGIIKILELLFFATLVLVSLKLFKEREMLFFWYSLIFIKILLPDSYTYMLSMLLFYLGIYLIRKFKEKSLGDIAISLAGLNHPYIAATNIFTIFFKRPVLFIMSLAVLAAQVLAMKFIFFSGLVQFELDNILDLAIRSLVLLFPFVYHAFPKAMRKAANTKTALAVTLAGVLFIYPILYVPFEMGWKDGIDCFYTKTYSDIPELTGNIRIVDDCRNWIYMLPKKGMVTSLSPYFEGQYYQIKWMPSEYLTYLKESETSYVIYCKHCKIRTKTLQETGEIEILKDNFPVYAELQDYWIFDVSKNLRQ